jgi:hypothetical protein
MKSRNPARRSWLDGGNWIPHRLALLESPAWRRRPKGVQKLLERIEIEHLHHGGAENGNLIVTYEQVVSECKVSRKDISRTIATAVGLGLLRVAQNDEWIGDIKQPNRFTLTYLPAAGARAPTDEWATVSAEEVAAVMRAHARPEAAEIADETLEEVSA